MADRCLPTTAATSAGLHALGQRGEAPDVGEQDGDHDLLGLDRGIRLGGETICELLRDERSQRLARGGLFHHGGVEPLELVHDGAPRVAVTARHAAEQLGDLPIDGFLGRIEGRGDLRVAHALGHHVEQLALAIGGIATPAEPLGDDRIDGAATGVHLADRTHQFIALGDAILQQVGEAAVAAAEQGECIGLIVVSRAARTHPVSGRSWTVSRARSRCLPAGNWGAS